MNIPDLATKQAELHPDRVAFIDPDRDRQFTYEEINDRASRMAEFLEQHWGLRRGDRIATLMHNRVESVELLFACAKLGAILVPLNWRLAQAELDYVIRDAEPRGIVHDAAHSGMARALAVSSPGDDGRLRLLSLDAQSDHDGIGDRRRGGYEDALAQASGSLRTHEPRDERDLWYLIYTSGTTGRPKGVHQTPGMTLVNYLNIGIATELSGSDTFLSVLPLFHTGGWNLHLLPMFLVAGTTILPTGFDPEQSIRILTEQATVFFGVPAIYQALTEQERFDNSDFSRIRSWAAGGAAMPVPLLRRLDARGIQVRQGMGMTETGPTAFLLDEENAIRKAGSIGKPQGFVDVRIVDSDGDDVPQGERGELTFRGPGITPGYWNKPEETEAAFYPGGWLRSGDIGLMDEEGFYYIVDRAKDMYISGGENVYPAEVEEVILEIPQVRSCAVIGVPDDRWGEVGKALIELRAGAVLTADEVREFARERLARYKVPVHIRFVDDLPRNATGKVLKHELRREHR